jgi:DNA primase
MYARFRKRITFPIANEQGKVIAFTARALDSAEHDAKAGPKYMNSPETALYTKGQVLFNLDKAKAAIKAKDAALLVEGQMDCISLFMAGVDNVIATSGTAFTETQVRMLGRFTKRVWLNFDPDAAGMNAAEKTLSLLVEEGFEVKVITLEGGLDPDRYVREHGVKAYAEAVKGAARYADFLIERARKEFGTRTPEAKVKALNFLLPHIRRVPNVLARNDFAENAAQKLGIESALMRQELKRAAQQRLESVRSTQPTTVTETERILLRALLLPEADSARALAAEQLGAHAEWYADLPTEALLEVLVNSAPPENPFEAAPDDVSRGLLASAMQTSEQEEETTAVKVQSALEALRDRYLDRKTREVQAQIAEAEKRGDQPMRLKLLQELMRLTRERQR